MDGYPSRNYPAVFERDQALRPVCSVHSYDCFYAEPKRPVPAWSHGRRHCQRATLRGLFLLAKVFPRVFHNLRPRVLQPNMPSYRKHERVRHTAAQQAAYAHYFVDCVTGWSSHSLSLSVTHCFLLPSHISFSCQNACDGNHCTWDHTPLGIKYELLAGPLFTFIFSLATIPLGVLASNRWVNRKATLSIFLALWSGMTLATSYTRRYWHILLARIGLGLL